MMIIIDTREQTPWAFPEWVNTKRGTLKAGDYALEGDSRFAIERKSLDDFVGTVFSGWQRFQREIGRMEGAGFAQKIIIVEADYWSICFQQSADGSIIQPRHNHYNITPQALASRIAELAFMGVQCLFCSAPDYAAMQAYYLLLHRYHELAAGKSSCQPLIQPQQ